MRCNACGKENENPKAYCSGCGAALPPIAEITTENLDDAVGVPGSFTTKRISGQLALILKRERSTAFVILLINNGDYTASAPYVEFQVPEGFSLSNFGVDGNGNEGILGKQIGRNAQRPKYQAPENVVILPGREYEVAVINCRDNITEQFIAATEVEYEVQSREYPHSVGKARQSS